jgi:spore maturation protein CgeB
VPSPWWRTFDNPCYREGQAFAAAHAAIARLSTTSRRPDLHSKRSSSNDRIVRELIWRWVTPRWKRHVTRIIESERVDAVIVFSVPMSHLRGIPSAIRRRFNIPVVYYDGDAPMSFPEFGGMESGFNVYSQADPGEYDIVLCNSAGGLDRLRDLGAKRVDVIHWGADPDLFAPLDIAKETDVFFYGSGDRFRREQMEQLVGVPSTMMAGVDFAVGGGGFKADLGKARRLGWIPFNLFRRAIARSRINLSVTRSPHATVPGSSTARLFELAAAGAAIVSGPHAGIEGWFEPGQELVTVAHTDEAVQAYRGLLADPAQAVEMGRRARERVIDEHTYRHRAVRLVDLLGFGVSGRRVAVGG